MMQLRPGADLLATKLIEAKAGRLTAAHILTRPGTALILFCMKPVEPPGGQEALTKSHRSALVPRKPRPSRKEKASPKPAQDRVDGASGDRAGQVLLIQGTAGSDCGKRVIDKMDLRATYQMFA